MSDGQLGRLKARVTAEHVMLVFLFVLGVVFFVEPLIEEYPEDARVFPQLTAAAVLVGSGLLLVRNYLPGPIRSFVAEEVSITSDTTELDDDLETAEPPESDEERVVEKETIGSEYGYEVNDTAFVVVTAIVYFFAGWAAGFFWVTPFYVVFYTLWYKVRVTKSVFLAVLAMAILWVFMEFLGMPFDQGHVFDFSPFLPDFRQFLPFLLEWGGR